MFANPQTFFGSFFQKSTASALALTCLAVSPALAQSQPFAGVWIWSRAEFIPPPGITELTHMVEETMSVSRDDGTHYAGQIRQVFDDGNVTVLDEDFAEDGQDHPVGTAGLMVRMTALPDGGRHVVSGYPGESHDSVCQVIDAGRTLRCTGTHKASDGSSGDYVCVYHRYPHVIPITFLAPRRAHAVG